MTLLNALALIGAVGYGAYTKGTLATVQDEHVALETRAAEAYKFAMALLAGFGLLRLELLTWFDERAARASLAARHVAAGQVATRRLWRDRGEIARDHAPHEKPLERTIPL